jgi:hypothetical protein
MLQKENICLNGANEDFLKPFISKYTKFLKNSNHINIRKEFGSNDSVQAAPAKKRYAAKFNQSKSND